MIPHIRIAKQAKKLSVRPLCMWRLRGDLHDTESVAMSTQGEYANGSIGMCYSTGPQTAVV